MCRIEEYPAVIDCEDCLEADCNNCLHGFYFHNDQPYPITPDDLPDELVAIIKRDQAAVTHQDEQHRPQGPCCYL